MEKITGIVTGSEADITLGLIQALMDEGLEGEGLVDNRVWVVKSHHPERTGITFYRPKRCVMVLRDPIDCIPSLFHLTMTDSHDLSLCDEDFVAFQKHWFEYVELEISVWRDFHEFWLNAEMPVHIIRYEDMVKRPRYAMTELMKFMYKLEDLEGTVIGQYVNMATEVAAPQKYAPRAGKAGMANIDKYDHELLTFMANTAGETLKKLGFYQNYQQPDSAEFGAGNPNAWFEQYNAKQLARVCKKGKKKPYTSVLLNEPSALIRNPSVQYPKGRNWFKIANALRGRVTTIGRTRMKVSIADRKEKMESQKEAKKAAQKHVQLYKPSTGAEKEKADLAQLAMQIPTTPVPTATEVTEESKTGEKTTEDVPQLVKISSEHQTQSEEVKTD